MSIKKSTVVELEPDTVRIGPIISALIDQLVERRVARKGGDAHLRRMEVLGEVIALGVREVQVAEGIAG